jgi:ubiquinone/menaquinone biosynthesis C-methylase UbiE
LHNDPYENFAARYDLFFEGAEQQDADQADFLRGLFQAHQVQRILDCACGTGHDALLVHDLGYDTVGSDVSAAMLASASTKVSARGTCVPLVRTDFRQLPFADRSFDAVLCLRTSLPHLPDEMQVRAALCSMWTVIRPGGILILSQGLSSKLMQTKPRFIPVVNREDASRIFAIDYGESFVTINVLDVFHSSDRTEFLVDSFVYLLLLREDYQRLLSEAGFSAVRFLDGYSLEPYSETHSDQLVVVASR